MVTQQGKVYFKAQWFKQRLYDLKGELEIRAMFGPRAGRRRHTIVRIARLNTDIVHIYLYTVWRNIESGTKCTGEFPHALCCSRYMLASWATIAGVYEILKNNSL